ncbi:MAG: hypothetical protein R3D83_05515 [Caenibius sp.]
MRGDATVNRDCRAGDEPAFIAGEESDKIGDVFRLAQLWRQMV